jgi:hypothetical protein
VPTRKINEKLEELKMEDRAGRAGEVQKLTKNSNIQSYFKLVKMEEPGVTPSKNDFWVKISE